MNRYLRCLKLKELTVAMHVFLRVGSVARERESMMLTLDVTNHHTAMPEFGTTLWHCSRCDAFISIRSVQITGEAMCPVCGVVVLEFCGKLNNMPWVQFGDA